MTKKTSHWIENIRYLVENDSRTTSEIALDSRISHTHLKNILLGKYRACSIHTVASLARALNSSLSYLYYAKKRSIKNAKRSRYNEHKNYSIDDQQSET